MQLRVIMCGTWQHPGVRTTGKKTRDSPCLSLTDIPYSLGVRRTHRDSLGVPASGARLPTPAGDWWRGALSTAFLPAPRSLLTTPDLEPTPDPAAAAAVAAASAAAHAAGALLLLLLPMLLLLLLLLLLSLSAFSCHALSVRFPLLSTPLSTFLPPVAHPLEAQHRSFSCFQAGRVPQLEKRSSSVAGAAGPRSACAGARRLPPDRERLPQAVHIIPLPARRVTLPEPEA